MFSTIGVVSNWIEEDAVHGRQRNCHILVVMFPDTTVVSNYCMKIRNADSELSLLYEPE